MKRDEKNQQTRRRILDGALAEFARQGYGASSLNTICAAQGISKGIIYHYFKNKDELYLACVEECFGLLTEFLRENRPSQGPVKAQLEAYFSARQSFFRARPVYQPLFCEAVVSPPSHLAAEIQARRQAFDALNIRILENLLLPLPLRPGVTMAEVVDTFRHYQDFINATEQTAAMSARDFELRDRRCLKALDILLYGVIEREEERHVG
ncbi:MAG: TetR/AcrR family transcriptional regulator [Oscillospiraceae bacterium]